MKTSTTRAEFSEFSTQLNYKKKSFKMVSLRATLSLCHVVFIVTFWLEPRRKETMIWFRMQARSVNEFQGRQ